MTIAGTTTVDLMIAGIIIAAMTIAGITTVDLITGGTIGTTNNTAIGESGFQATGNPVFWESDADGLKVTGNIGGKDRVSLLILAMLDGLFNSQTRYTVEASG